MKKAVIVLPSYNEKEGLEKLIPEIFAQEIDKNIWELAVLVANDESSDGSAELVNSLQKNYQNLYLLSGKKESLVKD